MSNRSFFNISDFAKFSRTTRDTLLHYDKIGLLSPVSRESNNYRNYSSGQLALINVIRTLQELGMTLGEIKEIKDRRTPENMDELLLRQIEHIDTKIDEWLRAKKLLLMLTKTIHSVLDIDEEKITVQFLPAESIVLGDLNEYNCGINDYDALTNFYRVISKKYPDLNLNYPVWGSFSEKRIKQGDWIWPDRFYFSNPEGQDQKPAALYAIGYTRGGYGQSDELYKRMIDYINKNDLEICGDAFEEYPLNEVSISNDTNYLMRVMITVREKTGKTKDKS